VFSCDPISLSKCSCGSRRVVTASNISGGARSWADDDHATLRSGCRDQSEPVAPESGAITAWLVPLVVALAVQELAVATSAPVALREDQWIGFLGLVRGLLQRIRRGRFPQIEQRACRRGTDAAGHILLQICSMRWVCARYSAMPERGAARCRPLSGCSSWARR